MEAIEELAQLSESMHQASALLADEDVDDTSSTRRTSTFLNVVVVGNVGAGKSAVLNSLIGHPVLPTGENGVTRAPISIDLDRDSSLSSRSIILQIDTKSQQVSASAIRHSLQDKLSKGSPGRSRDEIYLKLRTSTAPPLKLIDLPGLDQRNMDDSMVFFGKPLTIGLKRQKLEAFWTQDRVQLRLRSSAPALEHVQPRIERTPALVRTPVKLKRTSVGSSTHGRTVHGKNLFTAWNWFLVSQLN